MKTLLPMQAAIVIATLFLQLPVSAREAMDVMSFNIRYGLANDGEDSWEHRQDLVMDTIRQYAPDIVGLQEALPFQLEAILKTFPEFASSGVERDGTGKGEYAALLYRRDRYELLEEGTFWYSDTPEVPSAHWGNRHLRICSWARFRDKASGIRLFVYNTHWDHQSQPSREKSALMLARRIQERSHPDPVIVTGDFNAGESNPAILYLKGEDGPLGKAPQPLKDSFRILHPDETVVGTFNGFKGTTDGEKIDYIFVSPDLQVLAADIVRDQRDGHTPSDHFPVLARMQLRAPGTPD